MPAPACEYHAGLIGQQSGKRILAAAWRLERISAVHFAALQIPRLAGNAEFILRAVIERLEFGVSQGPVGERRIGRDGGRSIAFDGVRSRAEVIFVEAPGKSAVVNRPASGLIAVIQVGERLGVRFVVRPPGNRLLFYIRAKVLALKVAQFVQPAEILSGEPGAALQTDHFHPRFGKFGGNDPAHCSHAHNDDVGFEGCHRLPPLQAFGLRLQSHDARAREGLFILQVSRREISLSAWKTYQAPTCEVSVPTVNWIREHPLHRVRANYVKKLGTARPGKLSRLPLLDCGDDCVLPAGVQLNERRVVSLATMGIELCEPGAIEILKIGIGAGERQIDVVDHSSVIRSGFAWRSWHEPLSEGCNRRGLLIIEKRAMLNGIGVHLFGCLLLRLGGRLGVKIRRQPRTGRSSGAHHRLH